MNVRLKSIGDLRDYFGREPQDIQLHNAATVRDLYRAIDDRWGESLPAYLWDRNEKHFRGPVVLLINKEMVQDQNTPLHDGLELVLMRAIVGG